MSSVILVIVPLLVSLVRFTLGILLCVAGIAKLVDRPSEHQLRSARNRGVANPAAFGELEAERVAGFAHFAGFSGRDCF